MLNIVLISLTLGKEWINMYREEHRTTNNDRVVKFYNVNDVVDILGVSRPKAYAIMRQLNLELASKGYIIVAGKVSAQYFDEKLYIKKAG